ncbi:MAG: hypothetical protein IPM42_01120 [Saprospiraceae bacterium]|nr:hypothetical protein [Saprospiraceae bacterium]
MKNLKIIFLPKVLLFVSLILLLNCNKSSDSIDTTSNTLIKILLPLPNESIKNGDNLIIKASITSDISMHGYEILIHDTVSKKTTQVKSKHTHGKVININENLVIECAASGIFQLEVVAIIDHKGLRVSEKIDVVCNL